MTDDKFMLIAHYAHFCFDFNSNTMNFVYSVNIILILLQVFFNKLDIKSLVSVRQTFISKS